MFYVYISELVVIGVKVVALKDLWEKSQQNEKTKQTEADFEYYAQRFVYSVSKLRIQRKEDKS